jgi:hypothetical protein
MSDIPTTATSYFEKEAGERQKIYTQIHQRLSLRKPQTESLQCLHSILDAIELGKSIDPASTLEQIKLLYPSVDSDGCRQNPSDGSIYLLFVSDKEEPKFLCACPKFGDL